MGPPLPLARHVEKQENAKREKRSTCLPAYLDRPQADRLQEDKHPEGKRPAGKLLADTLQAGKLREGMRPAGKLREGMRLEEVEGMLRAGSRRGAGIRKGSEDL